MSEKPYDQEHPEIDFDLLAAEAEKGYDVEKLSGLYCVCPRDEKLRIVERLAECPLHGEGGPAWARA